MNRFPKSTNLPKLKLITPLDSLITNPPLKLIDKLPVHTSKDNCSICLSEFSESDPGLLLFCFHSLHRKCVQRMILKQGLHTEELKCPVCKSDMI